MAPALVLAALVLLVALLAWRNREKESRVRCCQPGQWPPDDLTGDGAERPR